ncbi:MAG: cobalamin-dependent protein [Planctomycetes bacterium]|nr:cobalamin-dependent protein [Planctomycetota bacterium]
MKILLINPPCDSRTIGLRHIARVEPLGLELVGAAVSDKHEVRLVDMEVDAADLARELKRFAPDIVGVTSEIVHRTTALDALRQARRSHPNCLTVVGGHHATMMPEDFDDPVVDLVVIGEGVHAFREICAAREQGEADYSQIAGLALRQPDGTQRKTRVRPQPANMNDYPFPDRGLTARYRKHYYYLFERSVAAVRTSYGCNHHCTFCSVRVYSEGAFIARSPELVYEEIRLLKEDFVIFCDDHSFIDPERMRKLAQLLIDGGVKKRYFAYARTDSIVAHRDVYALWAKAGLTLVMTGLEALDEAALRRSGKNTSAQTNEDAVRIAGELGFFISAGFLVESHFKQEDFERIDRYVRQRPSILLVEYTPLTPFPGTPLYRQERKRLLTEDYALFDIQHFVLPTELPARELYRLMMRYYRRAVLRVLIRLIAAGPLKLLNLHSLRLLRGMGRAARAYRYAHREIPAARAAAPVKATPTRDLVGSSTPQ